MFDFQKFGIWTSSIFSASIKFDNWAIRKETRLDYTSEHHGVHHIWIYLYYSFIEHTIDIKYITSENLKMAKNLIYR